MKVDESGARPFGNAHRDHNRPQELQKDTPMRFVHFNNSRLGVVVGSEIVDVTTLLDGQIVGKEGPLHALLSTGAGPEAVTDDLLDHAERFDLSAATLHAPLPLPNKVVAAPVNYYDHQKEMASDKAIIDFGLPTNKTIVDFGIFLKSGTSVSGPETPIELPYSDVRIDQEGELGVVIGRRARNVGIDEARDYVFGYVNLLDITCRGAEDRSMRKSYDTFTPIGPWVVTADEVPDPNNLDLKCWVNDELRQDANTAQLICNVDGLISYASSVMTLLPGDIIATGTPAGVGPLANGDSVRVEIGNLGTLEVTVTDKNAVPFTSAPVTLPTH
ncbi:fumarylacetoacetate hydrolase family protein [Rhodococcus sp. T2V]|uniref:fumarylacetoacetate hydrolase family protein n=1 Tax=Rhodococcus sp. T2V TaxID=3034164 RepID=UPI0023E11E71|nr:fumarylacetoacetate hydrolase family protein [Rhodococcus sp. T2V]MDF3311081.1 fumarylacetoacetate hydrolase family protein [Rhodococcus sp. T2V]